MAEAGCDRIHFGVEVGNDRMMQVIRKNTNVERVKKAFTAAKVAGLERLAYFIVGQQTETADDVNDTMNLAKALNPDYVHFTVFCPYPGTEIYMRGLDEEIIKQDVWSEFALNPVPGFELPVWEENFTRAELREMLVKCYKSFYLRPGYIVKKALNVRSAGEFTRKARAGISVLTMRPNQKVYDDDLIEKIRYVVPGASYQPHTGN
jgi:radical SAM superfamily enzyme YgiQ (UPF0313 family)